MSGVQSGAGGAISIRAGRFLFACVWTAALVSGGARAQSDDDNRDVVTLKNGKVVKGRVLLQFGPDEVLLMQNGSRRRIPKKRIQKVVTVNDHLRVLLQRRERHAGNQRFIWTLVQWAKSKGLHDTARLLALELVLKDDNHEAAHKVLGNRPGRRGWRWKYGDAYRSRKAHEKHIADMGHPLKLRSEHFEVQTDAGLRKALETLLDLERLYLFYLDSFGRVLQLQESLRPTSSNASIPGGTWKGPWGAWKHTIANQCVASFSTRESQARNASRIAVVLYSSVLAESPSSTRSQRV